MRIPRAFSIFFAAAIGCTPSAPPPTQPAPSPEAVDPVPQAHADPNLVADPVVEPNPASITGPIHFVWTDFHFEMGTAIVEIRNRTVRDLYVEPRQERHKGQRVTVMVPRLATYELTDDELGRLREALTAPEYLALDTRYINKEIVDGSTQTFTVLAGEHTQDVYTYQEWPRPVQDVRKVIRAIQDAHAKDRKRGKDAKDTVIKEMEAVASDAAAAAGRTRP